MVYPVFMPIGTSIAAELRAGKLISDRRFDSLYPPEIRVHSKVHFTPVKVARVGINTSATMLTASDHDRASRMVSAPVNTTGIEQASAQPAISHRSVTGM